MTTIEIGNYTDLQTAIADWLVDQNLDGRETAFIQLAEAMFNRDIRSRRMLQVYDTASTTAGEKYISLPDGFIEARSFKAGNNFLIQTTPQNIATYTSVSGTPNVYAIVGDYFQLFPVPDGAIDLELTFIQKIPSLSNTVTNNWLLIDHPDVYLYGSLLQAAMFINDSDLIAKYSGLYQAATAGIKDIDDRASFSGGSVSLRVDPRNVI